MAITSNKFSSRWRFLVALLLFVAVAIFTFLRHQTIRNEMEKNIAVINEKAEMLKDMHEAAVAHIYELKQLPATYSSTSAVPAKTLPAQYLEQQAKIALKLGNQANSSAQELELQRKIGVAEFAVTTITGKIQALAAKAYSPESVEARKQYWQFQSEKNSAPASLAARNHEINLIDSEIEKLINNELVAEHATSWLGAINDLISYENEASSRVANIAAQQYEESRKQMVWMFLAIIVLSVLALWSPLTQMVTQSRA